MASSSLILQTYFETFSIDKKDKQRYSKKIKELLKANKGADFLTPLNYYLSILDSTEPAMLPFMTAEKKHEVLRHLQVTLMLLMTQSLHEKQFSKTENQKKYASYIKKCRQLIDVIQYEEIRKISQLKRAPDYGYGSEDKPVQYLGLAWGSWFADYLVSCMDRKTKTIKEAMGALNEKRLYWVWGSNLLKTVLGKLSTDVFNLDQIDQTKQAVGTPDPYTGYLSWILYYFRGALNLGLLLKHTIRGPWMTKEEKKIPWTERFPTQWNQRKFTLLNDWIWATANMACFFWLNGRGTLGVAGDIVTLALLVFDISIALWDLEEQRTRYNKEMLDYNANIQALNILLQKSKKEHESQADYDAQQREYRIQLDAIEKAKKECQKNWAYQKVNLIVNVSYALGLMLAFALLSSPLGGGLTVAGAVLCFSFTVLYNAVRGGIEIHKTRVNAQELRDECSNKIAAFLQTDPPLTDNEKRLLFLEIKKLKAETRFQEDMVLLQTLQLIRSLIFEIFLPALIFVGFMFFPMGAGFILLAEVLILTIALYFLINAAFKPEKEKLGEFNEKEFQTFCNDPEHWDPHKQPQTFFSHSTKKSEDTAPQMQSERTKEEDNDEPWDINDLLYEGNSP